MQRIARSELLALLDTGRVVLVEALPAVQYAAEHLPGAVNLPGSLTAELARQLAPELDRTVVTYCSGPACRRSLSAAMAFERLGYTDVRVYGGGKADWVAAGLALHGTRSEAA